MFSSLHFFAYCHRSHQTHCMLLSQFITCDFLVSLFWSMVLFSTNIFLANTIYTQHYSGKFLFPSCFFQPTLLFGTNFLGEFCFSFFWELLLAQNRHHWHCLAVDDYVFPSESHYALLAVFTFQQVPCSLSSFAFWLTVFYEQIFPFGNCRVLWSYLLFGKCCVSDHLCIAAAVALLSNIFFLATLCQLSNFSLRQSSCPLIVFNKLDFYMHISFSLIEC